MMRTNTTLLTIVTQLTFLCLLSGIQAAEPNQVIDSSTLKGRVMCGYQTWFRCPGDESDIGWYHWVRSRTEFRGDLLTVDMWPDVSLYPESETCPVPGFTHPDGAQARLFTSDSQAVVAKHFELLRDYGIDGVWLQRFLVGLPGKGPLSSELCEKYSVSHERITNYIRESAHATGRVWAISYDIAGMPNEHIYETLIENWQKTVDSGIVFDDRYMKHDGKPVVQIWGFYSGNTHNHITAELANRLIDFFEQPGTYQATLVGGGSWDWRVHPDPEWRAYYKRFKVYSPWNIGNFAPAPDTDQWGASMGFWEDDRKAAEQNGTLWIPTVYPGFTWDNLTRKEPGMTLTPRRKGMFLWEQFRKLAEMKQTSVYVAMFDEYDEGTAILPICDTPPTQGHFVDNEGMPADWYLRIVGEGAKMLRGEIPYSKEIPFVPDTANPTHNIDRE